MILLTDVVDTGGLEFNIATFITVVVGIAVARLTAWLATKAAAKKKKEAEKDTADQGIDERKLIAVGVTDLHAKVDNITNKVNTMEKELQTNGGSGTVKELVILAHDKVIKCNEDICVVQGQIEKIEAQSSARLEASFNQSSDAQFLCNEIGDCTFVNDAMVELYGMNKPHFMGRKWLKALENQEEREKVNERWSYSVKNKIPYAMKYSITNQRTRSTFKVMVTAEPILDAKGNFMWYHGRVKAITEK